MEALAPGVKQVAVHVGDRGTKVTDVALFSRADIIFRSLATQKPLPMQRILFSLALATSMLAAQAQYGSFDAATVKAARSATTVVVLDNGDSPFNRMLMEAMKSHWKYTKEVDYVNVGDLATMPMDPARIYVLKSVKVDPVKFEGTFLTVVKGWKQKKGDMLQANEIGFTNVPTDQELASILIDPKSINENLNTAMLHVYVKHLQDFLKNVETGKIIDKATADRLYASRTRLIRECELLLATEQLDKSLSMESVKSSYGAPANLLPVAELMAAVTAQDKSKCVGDMLLTGDHKARHCFKRIFNAGTGELMYLGDDQALAGKKEGFIVSDLTNVARAR